MTATSNAATIAKGKNAPISDRSPAAGPTPRDSDRARDADLVARVRAGDSDAFGLLFDAWFDRVHHLARRIVRDPDLAAETAQDAFLAAWQNLDRLTDPASFGGWLLRITRNGALDRAGREARSTAFDTAGMAMIERSGASPASAPAGFRVEDRASRLDDPASVAGDAELVALVHEAVTALEGRDAEVLDLQLRYQLTPAEVGEVLGLNRNAANQLCHRVRRRFAGAFAARTLWRDGAPRCPRLAAALDAAGTTRFGPDVVRVATRHLEDCAECEEARRTRLSPSVLFGAAGLTPVLATTRVRVAHALDAQGIPMQGSTALGGAAPSAAAPTPGSPARTAGPSRRALALAGVAAMLLLVAFVAWRHGAPDRGSVVAGGPSDGAAGLTVGAGIPPRTAGSTDLADHTGSSGVATSGDGTPTSPTTAPTAPTSPTAPTTIVPGPRFERFTLSPSTPQPNVYDTATGPVLTWSVTGATSSTIRRHFDDGTHGDVDQGVAFSGPSGSFALCPGSPVAGSPGACTAPAGRYSYELVVTAPDGTTTTAPDRPGFEVLAPVIY